MAICLVVNSGVPNENSRHLLQRVETDILEHQPDLVILMIGANDTIESTDLVPLEEYRDNVKRLVETMQNTGSQVMLLTLPLCYEPYLYTRHLPSSYGSQSPNARIMTANHFIRQIADDTSCHLVDISYYFDILGSIGENEMSLVMNIANSGDTDGVHPTADGYRLIASLIDQYIKVNNLAFKKIICFGDSITFGAKVQGQGTNQGLTYPAQLQALLQ